MNAQTTFQTEHAARYLGTLYKHFGHKVPVQLNADRGRIEFPFGKCDLSASAAGLSLKATADDKSGLDKIVQVITSHLERFAFRENPQLEWHEVT
jgi:hypothetical protein